MKNITILKAIVFTILYILLLQTFNLWSYLSYNVGASEFFISNYTFLFFIDWLIRVGMLYLFVRQLKTSEGPLPQKTDSQWYFIALCIGITFPFFQFVLKYAYNLMISNSGVMLFDFDGMSSLTNLYTIMPVILAPIGEELFFREYIQNGLQRNYSPILAIITTSILFSAMHFPLENIFFNADTSYYQTFMVLFLGPSLSVVYYKSKSIGPAIILHAVHNLVIDII